MKILPEKFTVLEYCGVWPSIKYYFGWRKILYDIYTLLVVVSICTFCLSGLIQLFFFTRNLNEFFQNCFLLLTLIGVISKVFMTIFKHKHIKKILKSVEIDICQARNEEEKQIQSEWDGDSSVLVQLYRFLTFGAVSFAVVGSIKNNIPAKTLPFSGWLPFDCTSGLGYWIAFVYQCLANSWAALIASSSSAVLYGIMMHTCAQLKILKCRFRKVFETIEKCINFSINHENNEMIIHDMRKWEKKVIGNCIQHYIFILQFANVCNDIVAIVIFVVYSISGMILCVSAQILVKLKFTSPELPFMMFFLAAMLLDVFLFCWFGNEVIIESSDIYVAIYEMDWSKLSLGTQKDLIICMTRSLYPIEFSSGYMVSLSINSFNALIKLSYSLYNFLR